MAKVVSKVVPVTSINNDVATQMYKIMQKYYDGVEWETFTSDLKNKDDVILLLRKKH
ncbi:MAG: hypothetical protein AAGF06_06420 [Pseudomonadota bacterium]